MADLLARAYRASLEILPSDRARVAHLHLLVEVAEDALDRWEALLGRQSRTDGHPDEHDNPR